MQGKAGDNDHWASERNRRNTISTLVGGFAVWLLMLLLMI